MSSPQIESDPTKGLHRIEDELTDTWVEDWAAAGIAEIEESLGKHAAFLAFLEAENHPSAASEDQVSS